MHRVQYILPKISQRTSRCKNRTDPGQCHLPVAVHLNPIFAVVLASEGDDDFVACTQDVIIFNRARLRDGDLLANTKLVVSKLL